MRGAPNLLVAAATEGNPHPLFGLLKHALAATRRDQVLARTQRDGGRGCRRLGDRFRGACRRELFGREVWEADAGEGGRAVGRAGDGTT